MPTILLELTEFLILLPNTLTRHELSVPLRSAASVWRQLRPWLKVHTVRWAAAGLLSDFMENAAGDFSCWR